MKLISIDCETTGLNPWKDKLLGVSVYDGTTATYYRYAGPNVRTPLPRDVLADPTITKLGHNLRFDIKFLTMNGIEVAGPWEDTKLMAQLLNENRELGLKPLVKQLRCGTLEATTALKAELARLKLKMGDLGDPRVDKKLVADYCNEDTVNTWKLWHVLQSNHEWGKFEMYYYEEMLPLERVLMEMELRGNRIDMDKLAEAGRELTARVGQTRGELNELLRPEIESIRDRLHEQERARYKTENRRQMVERPVFNWDSPTQKRELFYTHLNLGHYCHAKTPSGEPALDRKTLATLDLPDGKLKTALDLQVSLQSYSKMISAYVDGFNDRMVHGRIHGEYYQASGEEWKSFTDDAGGTVTGRLSHRNPNLGNLPRKSPDYWRGTFVKDLFIPEDGHAFIYADFSAIELRVAAHLANDEPFIEAFNSGGDPHQQTADLLGITRQHAKTVNFLLIYGGSAWRLCHEMGWDPQNKRQLRDAEAIRNNFFNNHESLRAWIRDTLNEATSYGRVTSMFGRRRIVEPDIWSCDDKTRKHAEKQAGNFVVQSVAASICKRAMLKLHDSGFILVNQVHDSITCHVEQSLAEAKLQEMQNVMCNVVKLKVPLTSEGKILTTFKE